MSGKYSHILIFIFCGLAAALMTACGSSRTVTASAGHKVDRKGGSTMSKVEYAVIDGSMESSSRALLAEAKKWLGTPYKYGGEDRNGVDCSGLVLNVFRNALNIKLPRSSSKQMEYSSSIAKRDLIPGDLLFFATTGGNRISHVGMYIGEGKMVHSSTSRGVMVSRIEEDYFVKTFAGAGRVDAYYAMLSKSGKKNGKAKTEIVEPSAEPSFRFEPVAEIPVRTTPAVSAAPAPKAAPVVAQSASQPAGDSPEISADEARRRVLNSLIEQKLDSIYTTVSK
ncbi:MAG: C40 family peptidase [Duncaniella sp.]|nr:C40 family peptidase [Duncaniella sp.]